MGGSVEGLLAARPRAGRGDDNAAVVTCNSISMASSDFISATTVLHISRKETAVKERVDCLYH